MKSGSVCLVEVGINPGPLKLCATGGEHSKFILFFGKVHLVWIASKIFWVKKASSTHSICTAAVDVRGGSL